MTLDFISTRNLKKLKFASSQNQRLYNYLVRGQTITQEEARVELKIKRLAARIYDLGDIGQGFKCQIKSIPVIENGVSVASYIMVGRWC